LCAYTGGGLIPALIDGIRTANRASAAAEALQCVDHEMKNFDFQQKFNTRMANLLKDTKWLNVKQINNTKYKKNEELEVILQKENSDCILVSSFKYYMNPKMDVMTGTAHIALYPTSQKFKKMFKVEKPIEKPIFRFKASATEKLPAPKEEIEDNAKMWAQNNGELLKKGLDAILHQVFIKAKIILENPDSLPEN